MNTLSRERQTAILLALREGNSIRATCRLTGAAKATVLKLLVDLGGFCSAYQDGVLRDLPCTRVEADEIWSFVGAKARNGTRIGDGDIWTFTALCADTKLMIWWLVGARTPENADSFMQDVAARLKTRVQLTTDGHRMYRTAVRKAFGFTWVDYSQLIKSYGQVEAQDGSRRYSPPRRPGAERVRMIGRPDKDIGSTSFVARANLTMRMQTRRSARLTEAFSKKAENHAHAVSLHFMHYNFCRPHTTLTKTHPKHYPTTPAMAAGVTDRVWTIQDVLALMDPDNPICHDSQ